MSEQLPKGVTFIMLDMLMFAVPAILFMPVGYLLLTAVIWPESTADGQRIPRLLPGLMLATLLAMIVGWIIVGFHHFF